MLKCEGFMYMSAAQVARKWLSYGTPSAQSGRFGGSTQAMRFANSGVYTSLAGLPQTVVVGVAIKWTTFGSDFIWMQSNSSYVLALTTDNFGHIQLRYGTGVSTIITTSARALAPDVWHYIEVKHKIDNSTGSTEVRVNGTSTGWISVSSQDSQPGSTAYIDVVGFNSEVGVICFYFDYTEIYICDTAGSVNNNFLGDVRVEGILPTGAGNYQEFDTLVGSNHTAAVNNNPADDDTTYIASSTTGHRDTFVTANVTPTTGSVLAVQIGAVARKDDAGDRLLKVMARLSSTDSESAAVALATQYASVLGMFETKPGGGAWSITDVNNAEYGVRVG